VYGYTGTANFAAAQDLGHRDTATCYQHSTSISISSRSSLLSQAGEYLVDQAVLAAHRMHQVTAIRPVQADLQQQELIAIDQSREVIAW
jgi:hypothetical protein